MEGILKFTLPEEYYDFKMASQASYLAWTINGIDRKLRDEQKYQGNETLSVERVRGIIREQCEDNGIDFESLNGSII